MHYKGLQHGNADALSWKEYSDLEYYDPEYAVATTQLPLFTKELRQQQISDPVIHQIHKAFTHNSSNPPR